MALALDEALIAVDLPGQGHSDWWPDHLHIPEQAAGCALVGRDIGIGCRRPCPS